MGEDEENRKEKHSEDEYEKRARDDERAKENTSS